MPWICFALLSLIWGSTYFVSVHALKAFTPFGLVAARFVIGAAVCLGLGLLRGERWPDRKSLAALSLSALFLFGYCNPATSWAVTQEPSGLVAILCAPVSLWMALFSWRSNPLSLSGWIGIALGAIGVAILLFPGSVQTIRPLGCFAAISATAVWAAAGLYQRGRVRSGGLMLNTGIQMSIAAVIGIALAPVTGGYTHAPIGQAAALAALYLAIFGSCVAFSCFVYLAKVWNPTRAGTYAYINPIVAVALGAILLQEPVDGRLLIGMMITLVGVALVQWQTLFATSTRTPIPLKLSE
jgi:drug/metabolite transporter (DMT)-like permease